MGRVNAGRFEGTYRVIEAYWVERGYGPNLREVKELAGLGNVSTAHYHVTRLIMDGKLAKTDGERTLRPMNYGRRWRRGRLVT